MPDSLLLAWITLRIYALQTHQKSSTDVISPFDLESGLNDLETRIFFFFFAYDLYEIGIIILNKIFGGMIWMILNDDSVEEFEPFFAHVYCTM